ncbi:hypothetical protein QBC37DRAFT_278307 [Rhypophila decipiens]|uniref:2EXR domain-containing protein n=1 Tax=Rhypophila decipiens TaxID=261697 RepID=A0AAN6YF86_9PEZI|nr:hypothetical protein QBC37DRAFT_278307 [Rhypophila decipiens]
MHYDHNLPRCCRTSQSPETFTRFQRLPAEIRNMIWEYSLPESRVYEVLDAPNANQKTPAQRGLMFANVHAEPPPALAAVCRESRYFVLHHYKPLTLGATTKYVDLSRDILLLEPYLLVKRLHRTLHFMSQIPLLRDNMNRLALGTSYGIYTGICHPVLSWRVSKGNMTKLLSSLAKFPKLKMLIFVVHQEFQFEFDFRYPGGAGMMMPKDGAMSYGGVTSTLGGLGALPSAPRNPAPTTSRPPAPPPLPSSATTTLIMPSAARNNNSYPSGYATPSPSLSPSSSSTSSPLPPPSHSYQSPSPPPQSQTTSNLIPRPQQVHQAYRFKFDIEANINESPNGRPHLNEMLYYPLKIDEDNDDDVWDLNDYFHYRPNGEWCDPWPTNDDWRRFRKRFQRAINLALDTPNTGGGGAGAEKGQSRGMGGQGGGWNCPVRELHSRPHGPGGAWANKMQKDRSGSGPTAAAGEREAKIGNKKFSIPVLKGASLLWRYTRGGYV